MTYTMDDIRKQAIVRSLFPPTTLAGAVERLGFVQADPICAPARAQDLILRHRVAGYRAGDLERQYPALDVAEDVIHLYGYMPARTLGLLHPRVGEWRVEREYPGLAERVLEFVRANGETDHRSLEAHFGATRTLGNWGTQAKATTKILELLHYRGLLRVARRKGNVRVYAAAPPIQVDLDPQERLRRLVLLQARLYAPIPVATLRTIVRWLRSSAPSLTGRETAVADLMKSGDLDQAKVDGVQYVWPAGEWAEGEVPRVVRLLAPFDPVVWDRKRFEHLWGWPYRFEAYTPVVKRKFGHYTLPVLWVDRVIGWAKVDFTDGKLNADLGFVDGRPADREFDLALGAELERMRVFLEGWK
ncbi:MAG TPA: crosslink repair DNA glycosylase YcaQ family protein [Symbiobacteriaceae bacterium]|jgi:hypothetical protein